EHREIRRGVHDFGEAQVPGVEGNGGVDVIHNVANLNGSHSDVPPLDLAYALVIAARGLEQLNWIAGWIGEQDLSDGDAAGPLIQELDPCAMQCFDCGVEIGDLDQDPIPAAWGWHAAVGQGVPTRMLSGYAQQKSQIIAVQHGEHGIGLHLELETKLLAVEAHGSLEVFDEIA